MGTNMFAYGKYRYADGTGKIIYAVLFLVIVPFMQWTWAQSLRGLSFLPDLSAHPAGYMVAATGLSLLLWGMFSLKKFGKGLPMNAFPPSQYVKQGPYRWLRHPIYWGYGIFLFGISLAIGSAAGAWVVTPVSILGMIAIVLGYENIDLDKRFPGTDKRVLLDLPEKRNLRPAKVEIASSGWWLLSSILLSGLMFHFLLPESTRLEGTESQLYDLSLAMIVLILCLVTLILPSSKQLRYWTLSILLGLGMAVYLFIIWPGARPHLTGTFLLVWHGGSFSLPAPLFLWMGSIVGLYHGFPKIRWMLIGPYVIPGAILLVLTPDPFIDLLFAGLIFLFSFGHSLLWSKARQWAEHLANSWKEWEWGPIRIINHGLYVGAGAFAGILGAGYLIGSAYAWALLIFAATVIVCAGLWAQWVEGSDKLKRPFGYYGAVIGIGIGALILRLMQVNGWMVIGAVSVVMPGVQAIGRMRCLVNGCCHGRPTDHPHIGIRYTHARSRVCGISGLQGRSLHPTPLYAMLWLFLLEPMFIFLWNQHAPCSFLFGLYLILTGIGRFVEEAYRGEVQTPVYGALRLYQWMAIGSVVAGIFISTIPSPSAYTNSADGGSLWLAAVIGGFITFFAMGVDFPRSNARFSRLV